jgi:putative ABC transport system permease protein
MNLQGGIYLGIRYLKKQKAKTAILIAALTVTLIIPAGIWIVVGQAEVKLRDRAASTPLLLGAPGSRLELVFNALYFSKPEVATFPIKELDRVSENGMALGIPIYARFASKEARIVGTSVDYFNFRDLEVAEGRLMTRLGDCVVGARIAEERGLEVGGAVVSSPEAVFDIAGVYPLKMRVAGILKHSGTPDDEAVFCDVKTAWIIEGLAHGHKDARLADGGEILSGQDGEVKLNASVVEYNEITEANVGSFHFHGDPDEFPVTAVMVIPQDSKSGTILLGRYQDDSSNGMQLIDPEPVMDDLFATVFEVQALVVVSLLAVGAAAVLISILVFMLSARLRKREFASLENLGADRSTVRFLVFFEALFVLVASVALTGLLVWLLFLFAPAIIRAATL